MKHPTPRRHLLAVAPGLLALIAATAAATATQRPSLRRRTLIGSGLALLAAGGPLRRAGAAPRGGGGDKQVFDQIDVHRINIIEPDGTIRMILSDNARRPGIFFHNKERPHPNRNDFAGMLFFNDEGTECGGLAFTGLLDKDGKVQSGGGLSFDQYMQDELISFETSTTDEDVKSGLLITDRPDHPLTDDLDAWDEIAKLPPDQQEAAWAKHQAGVPQPKPRVSLGREVDRSASLKLKDTEGRDRIILEVRPDGTPGLRFLDEAGKVIGQLPEP